MNERLDSYRFGNGANTIGGASDVVVRNRVLRNTYWLLALSMVPTVLGAWLGVATGFTMVAGSPGLSLILFLGIAFGFFYAIEKTKNSGWGVVLLLAFTFFMGLMLSRLIGVTLRFSNGPELIMYAFGGTAAVFATMATIATTSKRDFSGMTKFLMVGAIMLLLAGIANIWLQLPSLMIVFSLIAIAIFSAFMLVDVQRVVNGGETNYVTATLAIYLDVYNVFTNLLALLGIFGGNRD
ncbi:MULTISPECIES: Bax inhibitor-1/YccA family protein [unclassified Cupriavidus]|uniref:Bax inhibitor-1/YccA family protein n=1 Tax=Cupriavidus sp. H19C3 TaxID=3241603 RepID=UPI003BF86D37